MWLEIHVRAKVKSNMSYSKKPMLEPKLYLRKHCLMEYIEDAISLLLRRKDEDSRVKPLELLAEYFKCVQMGTHVTFREFAFVSATPHNRASFLRLFHQTYLELAEQGDMMKCGDYLSLLRLLCGDFSADLVERVGSVVFSHNAEENLLSFSDFLYTFQVLFLYEQFLGRCQLLYGSGAGALSSPSLSGIKVVVMPTLTSTSSPEHGHIASSSPSPSPSHCHHHHHHTSASSSDNSVRPAKSLLKAVCSLSSQLREREPWMSVPSPECIQGLWNSSCKQAELSFYDFVLLLSRSDSVNAEIGVLPPRTT